ncbi:SDR family NAD(P)-dependent oxidoreductase [Streptomyces sp. NPDC048392]|uniref:SDR family NAD(P)-dependent oxidoreductase n=1 Tax=Streptomyces sp. NPDC048392 TaxID=3365543 RepID=UPI0037147930
MRLVEAAGGSARYIVADVSDESMVEAMVRAAIGDSGRSDFAVNNAGYDGEFQLTTDYSTEMLDRMIAVSIRGVFLSMKYELRQMVAQGFGSVVNMSSGAGLVGVSGTPTSTCPSPASASSSATGCSPRSSRPPAGPRHELHTIRRAVGRGRTSTATCGPAAAARRLLGGPAQGEPGSGWIWNRRRISGSGRTRPTEPGQVLTSNWKSNA